MNGLAERLPAYRSVGRNYKFHVLTACLALSHRRVTDVLSKTIHDDARLVSAQHPADTGGSLARQIPAQAPGFVPSALVEPFARRAVGLFRRPKTVRIPISASSPPRNRHHRRSWTTIPRACRPPMPSTVSCARGVRRQMLRLGYLPLTRAIPLSGTVSCVWHAGSGPGPNNSVVDAEGRVHRLDHNCYVVDGSVLPRSSRVNPALTIYAWGLRVASKLVSRTPARAAFAAAV
jgi:hypothetical protein